VCCACTTGSTLLDCSVSMGNTIASFHIFSIAKVLVSTSFNFYFLSFLLKLSMLLDTCLLVSVYVLFRTMVFEGISLVV